MISRVNSFFIFIRRGNRKKYKFPRIPVFNSVMLIRAAAVFLCFFQIFPAGYGSEFLDKKTDTAANRYFFWEISSERGKAYILGSIHMAKKDIYPLSENIEVSFESSDVLALEINLDEIDFLEAAEMIFDKGVYKDGGILESRISQGTYILAKDRMDDMGMNISMFNMFKPWLFTMHISVYAMMSLGFSPEWGVDNYFLNKARDKGKKITGMETLDEQIRIFDDLSDESQELIMLSFFSDLKILEKQMDALFDVWLSGNKGMLETIVFAGINEYPQLADYYEGVLYQRNRRMADKIEVYLKSGDVYFIVVGSAHLVGDKGVIRLLQDRGYKLNRR